MQHEYVGPNVMDFLIAPPMPEHVECYYKFSEELLYELETQETSESGGQDRKRYHSPEKPLSDADRSKRMRSEESVTSIVTSVPGLEEDVGEAGVTGLVERFLSANTGEIVVRVTRPLQLALPLHLPLGLPITLYGAAPHKQT